MGERGRFFFFLVPFASLLILREPNVGSLVGQSGFDFFHYPSTKFVQVTMRTNYSTGLNISLPKHT